MVDPQGVQVSQPRLGGPGAVGPDQDRGAVEVRVGICVNVRSVTSMVGGGIRPPRNYPGAAPRPGPAGVVEERQ